MRLQFLIFDASDDGEGTGTWEAMASVREHDVAALRAEVQAGIQEAVAGLRSKEGPTSRAVSAASRSASVTTSR